MENLDLLKGDPIQIHAGKYANCVQAWLDNSQTWHLPDEVETAPVIIKLRKKEELIKSTIWKSSYEKIKPEDPTDYAEAVFEQIPRIKKNLVTVTRQMAQCAHDWAQQRSLEQAMTNHFSKAVSLQESRGSKAIWRNVKYDDRRANTMIDSVTADVNTLRETMLNLMDTNDNKRPAPTNENESNLPGWNPQGYPAPNLI